MLKDFKMKILKSLCTELCKLYSGSSVPQGCTSSIIFLAWFPGTLNGITTKLGDSMRVVRDETLPSGKPCK